MARMLGSKLVDIVEHDHLAGLVHLVDGVVQRRGQRLDVAAVERV
jgi:hypothetical protein